MDNPIKLKEDFKSSSDELISEYGNIVCKFANLMFLELKKNKEKGGRDKWRECEADFMLREVEYHFRKLKEALDDGDKEKIREHAADVANNSLMVADIMDVIS